jgi:hypothetical protein
MTCEYRMVPHPIGVEVYYYTYSHDQLLCPANFFQASDHLS